jgi:hypothetical protein
MSILYTVFCFAKWTAWLLYNAVFINVRSGKLTEVESCNQNYGRMAEYLTMQLQTDQPSYLCLWNTLPAAGTRTLRSNDTNWQNTVTNIYKVCWYLLRSGCIAHDKRKIRVQTRNLRNLTCTHEMVGMGMRRVRIANLPPEVTEENVRAALSIWGN